MIIEVYIMPHERSEAIEAYRDRLHAAIIDMIERADPKDVLKLLISPEGCGCEVVHGVIRSALGA